MPNKHTRIFLLFYILLSCWLIASAFGHLHLTKNAVAALEDEEERTKRLQSLEFLAQLDGGDGISEHEFVLAILLHEGVLDRGRDVEPWLRKFRELDQAREGRLRRQVGRWVP
jgi:hypothetical protein